MKKITAISMAAICFAALCTGCHSTAANNKEQNENEKSTDADKQMEQWFWSRGYPDPQNINEKYSGGWQQAKELETFTRNLLGSATAKGESSSGLGSWVSLGPNSVIGGRTLSIAINPKNSNQLLIGTAGGGIWTSNNAGANWSHVVTGLPVEGVPSIIINPNNPKIIYAGTGEVYRVDTTGTGYNVWKTRGTYGVGIIKSIDGGVTWKQIFTKTQGNMFGVQMLQFDPVNKQIVYACCTDGLYKTINSGNVWTKILSKTYVSDIAINPTNTQVMVASVGNLVNPDKGLYRTTDGGTTWNKVISSAFPASWGGLIRMDNAGSTRLYAGFGTYGNNDDELLLSTDFGITWVKKTNSNICSYQFWYCDDIAIDPTNIDRVIMSGVTLASYVSSSTTNGNGTKKNLGGNVHSDIHDVIYDPNNSQIVYLACDGGMYKSINNGTSFTQINNGLGAVQIYMSLGVSPTDPNNIIAGLQDNGVIKYDGSTWKSVVGSDGGSSAFNQQNGAIVLTNTQNRVVYISTNSGNNFTTVLNSWPGDRTGFMAPLAISKSNSNYVYSATDIWHPSTNAGVAFLNDNQTLTNYIDARNKTAIAIGVSPTNSQKAYVSTSPFSQRSDGGLNVNPPPNLFKTLNAGVANATFTNVKNNLPDRFVLDFAFSKTNDDSVFITLGGYGSQHIYVTGNGGASWQAAGAGLPDVPFTAIVFDPINPQVIYAGCDVGVFVSNNRGATWLDYNTGFWDATQVYDLQISADNKLLCATHGKGVFKSDLFSGTVLPVNISKFTAMYSNGYNELNWTAETETNLKIYEVERSYDANAFTKVGTIKSIASHKYIFNDDVRNTGANVFYYRLKFIYNDGTYTYSNIVSTKRNAQKLYTIYGNPFTDKIVILFNTEGAEKVSTLLYNSSGIVVNKWNGDISGAYKLELTGLNNLAKGNYFLNIITGDKKYNEKLVKQ